MDLKFLDNPQPVTATTNEPPRAPRVPLALVWPQVIGGISFVLGVLTCLRALAGMASYVLVWLETIGPRMPGTATGPSLKGYSEVLMVTSTQLVLGALPQILLIYAGLHLFRSRPIGRTLHLIYAFVAIVLTAATLGVGPAMGIHQTGQPTYYWTTWLISVAVSMVYPVFTLIWFVKPRIRSEVAAWRQTRDLSPFGSEL